MPMSCVRCVCPQISTSALWACPRVAAILCASTSLAGTTATVCRASTPSGPTTTTAACVWVSVLLLHGWPWRLTHSVNPQFNGILPSSSSHTHTKTHHYLLHRHQHNDHNTQHLLLFNPHCNVDNVWRKGHNSYRQWQYFLCLSHCLSLKRNLSNKMMW